MANSGSSVDNSIVTKEPGSAECSVLGACALLGTVGCSVAQAAESTGPCREHVQQNTRAGTRSIAHASYS